MGERKVRSDKKLDVKPTMSIKLKKELVDFAELCDLPVKDVAEYLCVVGMTSKYVMDEICIWLRRDYRYSNTLVLGYMERPKLTLTMQGETDKVTFRLKQKDVEQLKKLAHALDLTPTSTATVLIRIAFKNINFMTEFVDNYLDTDHPNINDIRQYIRKVCVSK